MLVIELSDQARDEFGSRVLEGFDASPLATNDEQETAIARHVGLKALRATLPAVLLVELERALESGAHTAVLIHNCPVVDYPDTPVSGFLPEGEMRFANGVQLGIVAQLDLIAFSVAYENAGKLVRNVVARPGAPATSSWGSDGEFFWHSDNPQSPFGHPDRDPRPYIPAYLSFLPIRNIEEVPTEVVPVDDVVALLPEGAVNTLMQPVFEVAPPASNDASANGLSGCTILERVRSGFRARFDESTTTGMTPAAVTALAEFQDAVVQAPGAAAPVLDSGDFMVISNERLLHKRRGFVPAASARSRWLRRVYAS
jgi:hypothetical protein